MMEVQRLRKLYLAFLMLTLAVLASGCTDGGRGAPPIKSGYNGVNIELEFLTEEVFSGEKAPALIKISNLGAYDSFIAGIIRAEESYMRFSDFEGEKTFIEKDFLSNNARVMLFQPGMSIENPYPRTEIETVNFDTVLPLHITSRQAKADIDFCYSTGIHVDASLCINPTTDHQRYVDVCKVSDITFSQGQGSPVSLDKITVRQYTENYLGREIVVVDMVFTFSNRGRGNIERYTDTPRSEADLFDTCFGLKKDIFDIFGETSQHQADDYARIAIDSFMIGNQEMSSGAFGLGLESNIIKLDENLLGRVRLRLEKDEPYLAAMNIKMSYIYRQVSSGSVKIMQR